MAKQSSTKQATPRPYRTAEEMIKPSRVAEPLAVYSTARPSANRAPRRIIERRLAGLTASEEVWRFAVAHDLIAHLETAVRLVRECFPTVQAIKLLHEVDWEDENESWIAIDIKVVGTVEAVLEQYNRFTSGMVKLVPPDKGAKILLGIS